MLIQYSVSNYRSIKDEVVINFTAEKGLERDEWVVPLDQYGYHLFKGIGLLGPNASGKSNILDSFYFAIKFIKNTIQRKKEAKISVVPFLLDHESKEEGSSFEFIYIFEGIKYVYGFTVNKERVEEEYLLAYYSAKPTTVFERSDCRTYIFKGNENKLQKELSQKTNDNRLYMPVAAEWGYEKLSAAYGWFDHLLDQNDDKTIEEMVEIVVQNEDKKHRLINNLKNADFNIKDIYVVENEMEKDQFELIGELLVKLIPNLEMEMLINSRKDIILVHENLSGNQFELNWKLDSSGTEDIVGNMAELLYLSESGGLILEDELGSSYHSKLTQRYLDMIKSKRTNPGNVQLLFSTHDTKVLGFLNPGQIYLVDKDEQGATVVKLLDDFVIREKDNIELGYLKGRYGSIPHMKR